MSCTMPSRMARSGSAITEPGTCTTNVAPRWLAMYGLAWRKKSTNIWPFGGVADDPLGTGSIASESLERVSASSAAWFTDLSTTSSSSAAADPTPAVADAAFARGRGRDAASRRSSSDANAAGRGRARAGTVEPRVASGGRAIRAGAAARSRDALGGEADAPRRGAAAGPRASVDMDMPAECVPAVRAGGRDAHARACQCRQQVSSGRRARKAVSARHARARARPTRRTNIRASSVCRWLLSKRLRVT